MLQELSCSGGRSSAGISVAFTSMTMFWALGPFSTLLVGMVLLAVGICRL